MTDMTETTPEETKSAPEPKADAKPKKPAITTLYFYEAYTKLRGAELEKAVKAWADEISRLYDVKYSTGYRDDAWRVMFEGLEHPSDALDKVPPVKFKLH